MVWDGGAQAEVTTLQVIVLSRIEWLLVSVREAFFFFLIPPLSPFPQELDIHLRFHTKMTKRHWFCWGFTRELGIVSFSFILVNSWLHKRA